MRSGSTCHSAARRRIRAKAARASSSCGAMPPPSPRDGRPGRPGGSAREHLLHGLLEAGHVCRRLHEPVLQHECRDTLGGERLGDVRSFILHRQGAEAAARRHHHCGPGRVGRIRQIGSQRRDRDVAREEAPVLAVPGLLRRCAGKRPRSELDCVRLRRRRNRRHLVLLGERRRGQRTSRCDAHRSESSDACSLDSYPFPSSLFRCPTQRVGGRTNMKCAGHP